MKVYKPSGMVSRAHHLCILLLFNTNTAECTFQQVTIPSVHFMYDPFAKVQYSQMSPRYLVRATNTHNTSTEPFTNNSSAQLSWTKFRGRVSTRMYRVRDESRCTSRQHLDGHSIAIGVK